MSQPVTDTFTPSPGPEYQPVNAETARTTPDEQPEAVADAEETALEEGIARDVSIGEGHRLHSMEHRATGVASLHFTAWHNRRVRWGRTTSPSSTTRPSATRCGCIGRAGRPGPSIASARRRAGIRFWLVLLLLLVASVVLSVTVWHEIQRLFGL